MKRIFAEYADGKGPLSIVFDLNNESLPGPSGGRWNASALLGSRKRRNGILNNELYRGIIVYNRQRFLKDPATGKRLSRENPESEWHRQDVPDLRIIDDLVWEKVQARRAERSGPHLYQRRRPKRLLSGLLRCSKCGGNFSVVNDERMRCSTLANSRGCSNTRTIKVNEVEARVLTALQNYLLAPEMVATAVEAFREERRKLSQERQKRRHSLEQEAAGITRKIDFLMDMVGKGLADLKKSETRYIELTAEEHRIGLELADAGHPDKIELHPEAAEQYRAQVADIYSALQGRDDVAREAIAIVRDLIDHILVVPTPRPEEVGLTIVGNLAALLFENSSGIGGLNRWLRGPVYSIKAMSKNSRLGRCLLLETGIVSPTSLLRQLYLAKQKRGYSLMELPSSEATSALACSSVSSCALRIRIDGLSRVTSRDDRLVQDSM